MSRVCQVTGKHTTSGQNRPFSLKATKRVFRPNLFIKKIFNPETGKIEKMKISAAGIRTFKKWAKKKGFISKQEEIVAEIKIEKAKNKNQNKNKKNRVHKVKLTPKQKKEEKARKEAELLGKDEAGLAAVLSEKNTEKRKTVENEVVKKSAKKSAKKNSQSSVAEKIKAKR